MGKLSPYVQKYQRPRNLTELRNHSHESLSHATLCIQIVFNRTLLGKIVMFDSKFYLRKLFFNRSDAWLHFLDASWECR